MKTLLKIAAASALAATALPLFAQSNSANVTPEERTKIEETVHQYLLRKPEVLVEALQILQKKQMDEAQNVMKKTKDDSVKFAGALFRQPGDPVAGNPNAKVTVVEFFDYQCPHCVDMAPVIDDLIKSKADVRIVFKDFPIRGPMSEYAARAALAANLQGKYYELHHAMLTSDQPLTEESILKMAQTAGLNVEQFKKDVNDIKVKNQLQSNMKLGETDLKLFGTPAFFIGKTDVTDKGTISYIPGQMSKDQLQVEINKVAN